MRKEIIAYITAMSNCFNRYNEMVSTADVTDHLNDLIDFVSDLEEDTPIVSDDSGSDGMDEWYDGITNNLN